MGIGGQAGAHGRALNKVFPFRQRKGLRGERGVAGGAAPLSRFKALSPGRADAYSSSASK